MLLVAYIAMPCASASPLSAQVPQPSPVAAVVDTLAERSYALASGSLREALASFAQQSGLTLHGTRPPDQVVSSAVAGRFTAPAALSRLLAGTGFVGRFGPSGGFSVAPDSRAVYALAPIGVVARRRAVGYGPDAAASASSPTMHRGSAQPVAVVGHELINDRAMQGLADVLPYIPGARMGQGEGNRDQPTIRGNNSTSNFLVDGLRDDVQYVRDLYNVERVEGLFGANALSFGRGVGGGVINRVTKAAGRRATSEVRASGGSFGSRRGAIDVGRPVSDAAAIRVNAMYENSDLFRRGATLQRYGINPTVTVAAGGATRVTAGIEYFHDDRTADRGIPSFGGAPVVVAPSTFFGNPEASVVSARVTAADAAVEHRLSAAVTLTSRVRYADYDKFYQNVFPGAVTNGGSAVRILAYNDATARQNFFSQAEIVARVATGGVRHTLLTGIALGRQQTDILRNTGYFNDTDVSVEVPLADPVARESITFRPGASDADTMSTSRPRRSMSRIRRRSAAGYSCSADFGSSGLRLMCARIGVVRRCGGSTRWCRRGAGWCSRRRIACRYSPVSGSPRYLGLETSSRRSTPPPRRSSRRHSRTTKLARGGSSPIVSQ